MVIVGTGELGPGGTGRSRFALELDELDSPGVVAELAWLTGLVTYELEHYRGRWIDTATRRGGARGALAERYADAVARASACARSRATARSTPTATPCSRR